MQRKVSRAGRDGVCPHCGSNRIRRVWIDKQDKIACLDCIRVSKPCEIRYPVYKTDEHRILAAVLWLNAETKRPVSRKQVADHLGISKNPRLIRLLEFHVNTGMLCKWTEVSPDNSRTMVVYAPWVAEETPPEARSATKQARKGLSAPEPPWQALRASGGVSA